MSSKRSGIKRKKVLQLISQVKLGLTVISQLKFNSSQQTTSMLIDRADKRTKLLEFEFVFVR